MQTARGARPSIGQAFDHRVHPTELFDHLRWGVLGEGRLARANDLGYAIALAQDRLQAVKEEAATRLADVEQPDLLAAELR